MDAVSPRSLETWRWTAAAATWRMWSQLPPLDCSLGDCSGSSSLSGVTMTLSPSSSPGRAATSATMVGTIVSPSSSLETSLSADMAYGSAYGSGELSRAGMGPPPPSSCPLLVPLRMSVSVHSDWSSVDKVSIDPQVGSSLRSRAALRAAVLGTPWLTGPRPSASPPASPLTTLGGRTAMGAVRSPARTESAAVNDPTVRLGVRPCRRSTS